MMKSEIFRRFAALLCALALTLSGSGLAEAFTPLCDLQEHQHGRDCYRQVLVCGQEERAAVSSVRRVFQADFPIHTHTDACRDASGITRCGIAENNYFHTHNEYCRDANGNLVCGLAQIPAHTHSSACYNEAGQLTCPFRSVHTHTESCYVTENGKRLAVCGFWYVPEIVCAAANWALEQYSDEGHIHAEACYATAAEPACGLILPLRLNPIVSKRMMVKGRAMPL